MAAATFFKAGNVSALDVVYSFAVSAKSHTALVNILHDVLKPFVHFFGRP